MKKYLIIISLLFTTNILSQELNLKGKVFEKDTDITLAGATIQVVGSLMTNITCHTQMKCHSQLVMNQIVLNYQ